jgi:GntR family transcriptional regulator
MTFFREIDKGSGIPFYIQLSEQIRLLVHEGKLGPGDALPTVRELAVDLEVNANTVARVYRDLKRDGLLRLERGVGTFVAESGAHRAVEERDFEKIRKEAARLVTRSRRAGLGSRELAQLIETLYKEADHAAGN